jgi:hypothetical protein
MADIVRCQDCRKLSEVYANVRCQNPDCRSTNVRYYTYIKRQDVRIDWKE